jgi:hypothetical protein
MKKFRLALLALLLIVPFAAVSHAQVAIGVGVGPAVVPAPVVYGPPACSWGYYPYYPYDCAPYGYYGPSWFVGGVFIGAGPWYHWGYGHPYGWGHYGWGHYGYGYHGGVAYRGGYRYRGGYAGTHPAWGSNGGYRYGGGRAYSPGAGGHVGGGFGGGHVGGGFHGGGGGGFHGGGGHR